MRYGLSRPWMRRYAGRQHGDVTLTLENFANLLHRRFVHDGRMVYTNAAGD